MSRLPQIGGDIATRFRDLERRVAELEARPRTGVIASQVLTTSAGPYTTSTTTDFALNDVPTDDRLLYAVHLQTAKTMTSVGNWAFHLRVDGVDVLKLGHWNEVDATFPLENDEHFAKLWFPATGSPDLAVRVTEETSSGDLTLPADSIQTREFWVEVVGPRP